MEDAREATRTQCPASTAALGRELPYIKQQKEKLGYHYIIPKGLSTGPSKVVCAASDNQDRVPWACNHRSATRDNVRVLHPAHLLPCKTHVCRCCRQQISPRLYDSMISEDCPRLYFRRACSAAPSTRHHENSDVEISYPCGYAEWPPFVPLLDCKKHTARPLRCDRTADNQRASAIKALAKSKDKACHRNSNVLCNHDSFRLKVQRPRPSKDMFFCVLMFAALLCSLLCLSLLRHKPSNPLTQALMRYAQHKEVATQQLRSMIKLHATTPISVFGSQLLGKLLFHLVAWWLGDPQIAKRLASQKAVFIYGRPTEGDSAAAEGAVRCENGSSCAFGPSKPQQSDPATVAMDSGLRVNAGGRRTADSVHSVTLSESHMFDRDRASLSTAEEESAFLDTLTTDELRDLVLAEGGWTYIPHTRQNPPIELPDVLPTLPRPGGGRFLRRHHAADSPPPGTAPFPAVTVEQVLRNERQLLTAEAYQEAASAIHYAVRDGHLTRAVRLHGQFLYPWKMFSEEERESLRLLADQVRWFPKWVKHHRHSQRVDKAILDLHLPVVEPRFTDHYGGPGSPTMNFSQGIRYTWLGHAAGLVNIDGLQVLLDPMFDHDLVGSYNEWLRSVVLYVNSLCGSLGGRHRGPPCTYETLPADIDMVILSHNHQDHIMENDVAMLCQRLSDRFRKLIWYVPEGVSAFLRQYGCASSSIFEFSWGETRTLSCHMRSRRRVCIDGVWKKNRTLVETYEITFTAGLHWSGRSASKTDHNASLWGGFAINGPRHKFYYGGDTAYWRPDFDEFRKIGDILGPFHLVALPIGAYEPNEDLKYQHVKPHESLRIFKDVKAEVAVGVHWGTLRLSAEDFFDPMLDLECALLDLAEEDCHSTAALRHRYNVTEAYLRQCYLRHAKHLNHGNQTPRSSPASRREKGHGTPTGVDPSQHSSKKSKLHDNSTAHADHAVGERASPPGHAASTAARVKHRPRSRHRSTLFNHPMMQPPDITAETKEFDSLVQELQTLMLPMADAVNNSSNFQRLLRSLKLQEAGILPKTRGWKDNLLKEGARFQTLFVGQSIQVEASENNDFIWMTRSSALEHILSSAPDEHYTFNPMYIGDKSLSAVHAEDRVTGFNLNQAAATPALLDDTEDITALLQ